MEESKIENTGIARVAVAGPPERNKKKNIFINTTHCR